MGELYYSSEVYEKVAHETPSFVCFYTMVDVLPDFSVEFVINVILQSNFLLRLSTNFRSVHLLHANKVMFTAGFVLWYCLSGTRESWDCSFKKSLQASRSVDKDSRFLPNRFYPRFQEASRKYFRLFVVGNISRSSISDHFSLSRPKCA